MVTQIHNANVQFFLRYIIFFSFSLFWLRNGYATVTQIYFYNYSDNQHFKQKYTYFLSPK